MSKVGLQMSSDVVRRFVREKYLEPARRRGASRVSVNCGEVHKALGFQGRIPLVCSALRGKKFLKENNVQISEKSGPPSGMSSTVTLTYEFAGQEPVAQSQDWFDAFMRLRGIAKDVFRELGGGEEFIRSERRAWDEANAVLDRERKA